jgi:hypothetical protein
MTRWLVTMRREGGRTYEPLTIEANDRDEAAGRARHRAGQEWNVAPDTIEVVSVEPVAPN